MIFVDEIFTQVSKNPRAAFLGTRTGHQWCHCWSGTPGTKGYEELLRFADSIGLNRRWFQVRSTQPHFDLVPSKRRLALAKGARVMSLRTWFTYRNLL